MAFVFSPSNIMTWLTCPRKFFGQSISKELPYQPSAQKTRGMTLHEQIQAALRDINSLSRVREDDKVDAQYVANRVEEAHKLRKDGYQLYIEHELCMNKAGQKVGWWDDKAFLRAKADAMLLHKDEELPVVIVDVKTGKCWDKTHEQLRTEALLAHIIYQRPVVKYEYWYIDQGETEEGLIDFRNGIDPVKDLYETMKEMQDAIKNNDFPPRKNGLCRWCGYYGTTGCEAA